MAVRLRLRRMGKKKQPIYKIVAADARSPRDGKYLESIGLYNPKTEPLTLELNELRVMYWLGVGAQPTETVKSLLRLKGITLKQELQRRGFSEERVNEELDKWQKSKDAKVLRKSSLLKGKKKQTVSSEEKGAASEVKSEE